MSDFNTQVIEEFRANAGKVGGNFEGAPMVIITTTGAKSGQPRTIPLVYLPDGDRVVIFASKAGAPTTEQLTLTGVLQNSSNVGISMLGSQVPEDVRLAYMKKFGLGQKTAVDFLGEASGNLGVTGSASKPWDDQSKYNVLYGQGVSATALQVAQIFGTLANGGVRLPMTLVESCTKPDGTVTDVPSTAGTRVVSESTAKTVVNMLESVVQGGELSKASPSPTTFSGKRALDFVLKNQGMIDKTLLFDIELLKVQD